MCFHSEDIAIECIFISTILNLSLKGQQSVPILLELQNGILSQKTMFALNGHF